MWFEVVGAVYRYALGLRELSACPEPTWVAELEAAVDSKLMDQSEQSTQ